MADGSANNTKGAVLALLSMGIYATHDVVVKYLGSTYSAVQIVFFASILSFPLVTLISLSDKHGGSLRPRHPVWVTVRSVCTVITGVSAFYAFGVLPLAQTYAILFAMPLIITLLSIPVLGERVGTHRWLAVIVGLVGVLIVLRPGQGSFSAGHLAAMTAAITGATASIIARKIGSEERPVVMLVFPMLGNFLAMGAAMPFVYRPMPVEHLGLLAIIAVFGLAGSLLTILAYRAGEAVIVAPMQYSQILWATFYGFLLFDEGMDLPTLIGAGVIIASGIYIVLREGLSGHSAHRPVLDSRGRNEMVTNPRPGFLQRILGITSRTPR